MRHENQVIGEPALPIGGALSGEVPGSAVADLLQRWVNLSELKRRAFAALCQEVSSASDLVEQSALSISEGFRRLAALAQAQNDHMGSVIDTANAITVGHERVPLDQVTGFISKLLTDAVETIQKLSDLATSMLHALDDALREAARSEEGIARIEALNRQTRYLSLNALIEAAHAGEHASGFAVVANEVRALSQASDSLTGSIRQQITAVAEEVRKGHAIVGDIARIDTSQRVAARQRLDAFMAAMTLQNRRFSAILEEAAGGARDLTAIIGSLVVDLQFQDRTTQCLAHVTGTLGVLSGALVELQREAVRTGVATAGTVDKAALDRILSHHTLADVRERFAQLGSAGDAGAAGPSPASPSGRGGDIELF